MLQSAQWLLEMRASNFCCFLLCAFQFYSALKPVQLSFSTLCLENSECFPALSRGWDHSALPPAFCLLIGKTNNQKLFPLECEHLLSPPWAASLNPLGLHHSWSGPKFEVASKVSRKSKERVKRAKVVAASKSLNFKHFMKGQKSPASHSGGQSVAKQSR